VGTFITGGVSCLEFFRKGVCTSFTIIPSCYLALSYFIVLLITFLFKKELLFLFFSGIALVLTFIASVGHVFGSVQCYQIPTVDFPVCVIAFFLFTSLIILKFKQQQHKE
jgi:hypothetical protein